jgi:hypothetical protein
VKVPEGSLQAWVPGPDLSIAEVVDLAFDYRGNVTVEKADGTPMTGYIFNRDATAPVPFLQMFDEAGKGLEIPYAEVRTIRFTGRDTAAGTSWKAWAERHEAEKKASVVPREALVLTGIDLEVLWLARALELPALPEYPFPAFGDGRFRLAAVGLGARRLDDRFDVLAAGLLSPVVVSAGLCGALAPELRVAALVVPEVVLGRGGERTVTAQVVPGSRREGTLVTVEEITAAPAARAELRAATGAVAADMESSLILAAAARKGWPGLVLRAVSDDARTSLPPALLRLVDTDGRLRMGAAVGTLLRRPALLPRALELRRNSRRALDVVAEALRPLLAR